MERLLTTFVALVAILSFSIAGLAYEDSHHVMSYTGQVISVDRDHRVIIVSGKEGEMTFEVSKTMVRRVEPQENVRVNYVDRDGRMVASSVRVVGPRISERERDHQYGNEGNRW